MKINGEMTQMLKYANNFKAAILTMFTEKKKKFIMNRQEIRALKEKQKEIQELKKYQSENFLKNY